MRAVCVVRASHRTAVFSRSCPLCVMNNWERWIILRLPRDWRCFLGPLPCLLTSYVDGNILEICSVGALLNKLLSTRSRCIGLFCGPKLLLRCSLATSTTPSSLFTVDDTSTPCSAIGVHRTRSADETVWFDCCVTDSNSAMGICEALLELLRFNNWTRGCLKKIISRNYLRLQFFKKKTKKQFIGRYIWIRLGNKYNRGTTADKFQKMAINVGRDNYSLLHYW